VICLSLTNIAVLARFSKTSVEEAMGEDYIRAARSRGLRERDLVLRHALRNALVPLISVLGILLPTVLSGSIVIERIFQWNGIGQLFFEAALARDYPVVMGLTVIGALLVLFTSILVDASYALADPRVDVAGER
jgi:peptide/nickel transport system permease protein